MFLIITIILILIIAYHKIFHDQNETFKPNHNYNADELYTCLYFISDILQRFKIKHWLMYGTLLGAVRDNNIIPYDYDFDLGANVKDCNKILRLNKYIKKYGYKFYKPYSHGYSIKNSLKTRAIWRVSLKIVYKGKIMGDIYLYHKFKDGYMRRFDTVNGIYFWPKTIYPAWFTDKLVQIRIRDKYFPSPRDSHILLYYWYGKTWRTPIMSRAQGGKGDKNSDYYGGSKDMNLKFLSNYLKTKKGIIVNPNLDCQIKYIYPYDHKSWLIKNDNFNYNLL